MSVVLEEVAEAILPGLVAVDRLSSWVRSEGYRAVYGYGGPRQHIYYLKRQALIAGHGAGLCTHWPIQVKVMCHRCGGTGIYDDGYVRWACRGCKKGVATLRFWETALRGVGVWHTPVLAMPWEVEKGLRQRPAKIPVPVWVQGTPAAQYVSDAPASDVWYVSKEWTVRQVGKEMLPAEVCAALNVAEVLFPLRKSAHYRDNWQGDWIEDAHDFRLYLGLSRGQACGVCQQRTLDMNGSAPLVNIYQGPVWWQAWACAECARNRNYIDREPPGALPAEWTAEVEIAAWIARNAPLREARKAEHQWLYQNSKRAGWRE